jgi:hypothetical protein
MSIQHLIEPGGEGGASTILRVRCTTEQVGILKGLLAAQYPAQKPELIPAVDQQLYTHWCRVADSVEGLRGKFKTIELQLLLAGSGVTLPGQRGPRKPPLPAPDQAGDKAHGRARQAKPGAAQHKGTASTSFPLPGTGAPARIGRADPTPARPDPAISSTRPGESAPLPESELARIRRLRPAEQVARLHALAHDHPDDIRYLPAAEMLAEALEATARPGEAAPIYARLAGLPTTEQSRLRVRASQAYLAAENYPAVVRGIAPDEQEDHLQGLLGIALLRTGESERALPHLRRGWLAGAPRNVEMAAALARLLWQQGDYQAAAGPYAYLVEHAPQSLEADDYAALIELIYSGSLPDLSADQQLVLIDAFCDRASPEQRKHTDAQEMVRHGLEMARVQGSQDRLLRAYQHVLDDLLLQRTGAALVRLIEDAREDHQVGRLSAWQMFELLDEVDDYRSEYPHLLREPLIRAYEDLLQSYIAAPPDLQGGFASCVKDMARALRRLEARNVILERYRQMIEAHREAGIALEEEDAPLAAARGRRIALVGGHDRTREHVRERLESWGARVDEVAPPTTGRIGEREFDRVLNSDLIVEIVSYMGHDMSTIISNLKRAQRLRGEVLSVQCRGMSGVCREIARRLSKQ